MAPQITVTRKSQLHDWFAKNHENESKVFLISWKRHAGKPFLTHNEQMLEAICWGWIDTTVKRIDDERYGRYFMKRTNNSQWSTNTIAYAERMIKEGRMQPLGLRRYKEGLKKPIHDSHAHKNATMSRELKEALANNKKAKEGFNTYPPSTKRTIYTWIARAKRPETREKRIRETLELAKDGRKPFEK